MSDGVSDGVGPVGPSCPRCGGTTFVAGFIDEMSVGNGRLRWLEGRVRIGFWGGSKGRSVAEGLHVVAHRCTGCSRLELYAVEPDGL